MEPIIIGTEVKFAVDISAEGFDMDNDEFVLYLMKGRTIVKEFTPEDLVLDIDGTYLLCIDTEEIGVGTFDLAVRAQVKDGNFPDGYRTEMERQSLMTVKKL